jgi:hypothetical protein
MTAFAAAHMPTHLPADWPGWLFIVIVLFFILRWALGVLGIGKD